jgi:hypothetical protein
MSPVKYELDSYIPKDDILHSHRRENIRSYIMETEAEVSDTFSVGITAVSMMNNSYR